MEKKEPNFFDIRMGHVVQIPSRREKEEYATVVKNITWSTNKLNYYIKKILKNRQNSASLHASLKIVRCAAEDLKRIYKNHY